MKIALKYFLSIMIIVAGIIWLDSCAKNPVTGKRDFMLLSESQEKEMGRQNDPQIVAFFGVYQDPKLQNFINRKGKQMAAISHRPNLGYEFKIVDSPVINAFAVPGGYVYFTRGIMAHFNNEAEFAGVLGHEIGHITARHSAKQYSKSMLAQVGLSLGSVLSQTFGQFAQLANTGAGLLFLKFGRDAERQSDKLGVEYSSQIGYDAHQMADFFQTLERKSASTGDEGIPNFLSTHPAPGERYATVHRLATKRQNQNPQKKYEVNRGSYLDMIDGLVYGEDPRQGFHENNTFYHPELKFQFPIPNGWKLQNTPQQVQMAPSDGSALMIFTISPEKSLEAAANAAIKQYQFEAGQNAKQNINGLPALKVAVQQVSEQQSLRGSLTFIELDGNIYNFISLSTAQNYNKYDRLFNANVDGFARLTDSEKLNRKPTRIKIQSVSATKSLKDQLTTYRMPSAKHDELALLNGMQLTDQVKKGSRIKLIQ